MNQPDKNFDQLAKRLQQNVYASDKGLVRLSVLKHDMLMAIPEIKSGTSLKILDAGGGMGQIARWLAEMGHQVLLTDMSEQMLEIARKENHANKLEDRIELIHSSIQELPQKIAGQKFNLVLAHGVIEWMEKPEEALGILGSMLTDDGVFSLLFFNRDKLIMKWAINGQFDNARTGAASTKRKLTPHSPLTVNDLVLTFSENNLEISSKAGIRIFYGFFSRMMRDYHANQQTIELEKQYCRTEPFASLGEHTHLVLRRRTQNL